jgi:hypothetical protein
VPKKKTGGAHQTARSPALPPTEGVVLLARPHPLQFLPYQYEGYTPAERAALRAIDIRMRLVEVRARLPDSYQGASNGP